MSVTWNLTDAELVVAWERLFEERLPAPLCALMREHYADEYRRMADRTWDAMWERHDGSLQDALGRVAHADVRVLTHSVDPADQENSAARVRVLGARQGAVAVLIRQLPGETMWHSSGFVITMGPAERLAGAVVGALPPRAPGRLPDTPLVSSPDRSDTDHWYGRSEVLDDYVELERRSTAWLNLPIEVLGVVETFQGSSIFGPRGITKHRIFWRDLVEDGRYAIADTATPVAVAADPHRLAAMIGADIAKVLQTVEDERSA
ncbi:ESX secretion-associated protein EspG [Nocardia sp. alder85J]|uniref:ESX secretion-associated protein EspG n=1 Tax=Nocardia sp. alder85J TaxID=2862949 RepID=UPI001CD358E6|nr:ESX secretion-associated protein EspG [Nocardia sp. alder85J]MCX4093072.1 ESX secretion-associated protein EspG [Nocardia sp. alder85J]